MTKSRIFLFLLLAFIAGVALRSFLGMPIIFIWIGVLASAVALVIGILRKQKAVIIYGFLGIAFFVGVLRLDQVEQARPDLSTFYGKPLLMLGIIGEEPERTQSVQRLKIKVTAIDDRTVETPFYMLLTTRRYPEYVLGDELRVRGLLEEPKNFGDFDYVSYLSREDIYSTVSFPIIEKIRGGRGSKLKFWLSRARHAFEENLDGILPEPHAAFLKGLTLGERESLPADLVENFKRTGTTHIVALSGYNITMIGRFFIACLLFLTLPFRISFWIATSAIALFVILTGASPSVVRAGLMGILVLVAQREGRVYHMTNALAFAAAVMIFQNPKVLRFDAAFQLSFLATLGLIYFSPHVERFVDRWRSRLGLFSPRPNRERDKLQEKYKLLSLTENPAARGGDECQPGAKGRPRSDRNGGDNPASSPIARASVSARKTPPFGAGKRLFPFKKIFIETLSAQLAVLPLIIYLFGRVSLISPFSNILVLLAVPYSMALGFATGVAGFIWEPLSQIFAWPTWVLLEYKIRIIELFGKIPGASLILGPWALFILIPVYALTGFKICLKSKASKIGRTGRGR